VSNSAYVARLILLGLILSINAFFAGAEVSLLSVRDSRLRRLAEEGHSGAKIALGLLSQPEKLLSVTQIGVTLASLGLGWAGEDTLYNLLIGLFHPVITPAFAAFAHGACFVLAFLVMTYCHVVIGEVVPKNLAIARADRIAIMVAPVLLVFYRIAAPFVAVVERSSSLITRAAGAKSSHHGGGHSAEELKLIISSSRFSGVLHESQEDMIHRVLDLEETSVREIMRPRHEIVSVPINSTLDEVLAAMVESQHSRLPVWESQPEHMAGIVYFKDMTRLWYDRRQAIRDGRPVAPFQLRRLVRKPLIVPETKSVQQMLSEFQAGHTHMALIVDEFGTVAGLVTVEDVIEQIVGEITDEFDVHEDTPRAPANKWEDVELEGTTTIRDLSSIYEIQLPVNGGFETLAGYLLSRLGHIPAVGETVDFEGRRFEIAQMERNRIAQVRITRYSPAEQAIDRAADSASVSDK
jgi:CBS domain containing-hemolysin-like protein